MDLSGFYDIYTVRKNEYMAGEFIDMIVIRNPFFGSIIIFDANIRFGLMLCFTLQSIIEFFFVFFFEFLGFLPKTT